MNKILRFAQDDNDYIKRVILSAAKDPLIDSAIAIDQSNS